MKGFGKIKQYGIYLCLVIYSYYPVMDCLNELGLTRLRVIKIIMVLQHDLTVTTMLESLNWVTLASRRAEAKLIMLYRITNNLVDITTSALTAAPTRTIGNTHRYLQPFTRIEAYKHSFFPRTIKSWNKCTQQIVSKQSLDSFSRLLQSMPTQVHMFYYPPPLRNTTH